MSMPETPSEDEREAALEALADQAVEVVGRLLAGTAHVEITRSPASRPDVASPSEQVTRVRIVCD